MPSSSSSPPPSTTTASPPLNTKRSRVRLPHPFAKTSPGPLPSGSGGGEGGHRDLAIATDGSFVETTSEAAANALAKFYREQGAEEYVVQSREEGGRKMYRIRPRSRPPSPQPLSPSPSSSKHLPSTSPTSTHPPFARSSHQPPAPHANPTFALQAASPQRPLAEPKSLRPSRSIPALRTTGLSTTSSSIPAEDSSHLRATPSLRRVGSTPSLSAQGLSSTSLARSKSSNAAIGSQGDVLGRLLGWSSTPPPRSLAGAPASRRGPLAFGDRAPTGTAQLGLPGVLRGAEDEQEALMEPVEDTTDLPEDLHALEALPSLDPPIPDSPQHSSSCPTPQPSLCHANLPPPSPHPSQDPNAVPRAMREVASSDSIRTAKAEDGQHTARRPKRSRFGDPTVFDIFQGLPTTSSSTSARSHGRLPSSSSSHSSLSDSARAEAQSVSVSMALADDPRFVIWERGGWTAPSTPSGSDRRGSIVQEMEIGSPTTTASDRGSPATSSSKRWSLKDRRSYASNGESSPATSVRDSISSGGGGYAPHNRVLMAATVERWVAELTSKIEADLLSGFFLTYRSFVRPLDLLRLLITRFNWAMSEASSPEDEAGRRIVRVRTFVVIRHWLLNHFTDDFIPDRRLRTALTDWLNASSREERIRQSPKDQRLIKGLKKLVRRLKEMHVALGPGETAEAARVLTGTGRARSGSVAPDLCTVQEIRESSKPGVLANDEDVDLEFSAEPSAPGTLPISPPQPERQETVAGLAFLSKMAVEPVEAPRPPDLATHRSSQLFSPTSNFPLPNSQNAIARSFTSALGTFGRFKRMLGNRTTGANPGMASCVNSEAFDEVEFEHSDTGDLLWIKGGLDRYLEFYDIPRGSDADVVPGLEESRTSLSDSTRSEDYNPTPLASSFEEEAVDDARVVPDIELARSPSPPRNVDRAKSSQPIKSVFARLSTRHHFGGDAYDLLDQPANSFLLTRPGSARIELDDVDLSDEDEDVVEVKKTLKRLPAAHNLRLATTLKNLAPGPFRNSIDSVSSYGSPVRPERDSMVSSDEEDLPAGVQIVPNFILDGMLDSDDDEPGDVEAALRRLEGLVDETKEKEKARRVERQMEKSTQLERLKLSLASTQDDDDSDVESRRASVAASTASSPPASIAPSKASVDAPAPLPAREAVVAAAPITTIPSHATSPPAAPREFKMDSKNARSLSRKMGLTRKPSLSQLFAAVSRPLSARPGISPPTHRSFLLLCRTEVLAQQFCLIERDMLRVLGWQELVGGTWRDRTQQPEVLDWEAYLKDRRKLDLAARANGDRAHSDVQAVIARFNLTANWVCSEIVLTSNPDERVALIAKFIRLAFKCYCQSNFQTLTQIIHGLQSPDVERLKKTWARVPTWEMRKFRSMKIFVSHVRNFKHLREVTTALITEYGPPGQRGPASMPTGLSPTKGGKAAPAPTGCIPFLGLFLRDLTLNAELPTFLDPTSTNTPASVDETGSLSHVANPLAFAHLPQLPEDVLLRPLVNVHKFRLMAGIVQRVLAFQEFAEGYPYQVDPNVYFKCLKIRCLDPSARGAASLRLAQA